MSLFLQMLQKQYTPVGSVSSRLRQRALLVKAVTSSASADDVRTGTSKRVTLVCVWSCYRYTAETVLRDPIASVRTRQSSWWNVRSVTVSSRNNWMVSGIAGSLYLVPAEIRTQSTLRVKGTNQKCTDTLLVVSLHARSIVAEAITFGKGPVTRAFVNIGSVQSARGVGCVVT